MLPHLGNFLPDVNAAPGGKQPEAEARPRNRQEAKSAVFDRLRVRSYPDRPRYESRVLWDSHVLQLARIVNRELDLVLPDRDVVRIAERHAEWCWHKLRHFVLYRHDSSIQAWKGRLSGKARRHKVRPRDRLIVELLRHFPGTSFRDIARAFRISATQVMRVVRRDAFDLHDRIRMRFRSCRDRCNHLASARVLRRYGQRWRDFAQGKWGDRSHPETETSKQKLNESTPPGRGQVSGGDGGIRTLETVSRLLP